MKHPLALFVVKSMQAPFSRQKTKVHLKTEGAGDHVVRK